jgi:hypothetical protein
VYFTPPQDALAVAAARKFGVFPYDMTLKPAPESAAANHSLPASTPRTPHSPIRDLCSRLSLSDASKDHADSLWLLYCDAVKAVKGGHLDPDVDLVAAACVYLADRANKSQRCCSVEDICSAVDCTVAYFTRLSSKLESLLLAHMDKSAQKSDAVEVPIFYACVCDFGLSKVSVFHPQHFH